jgi:hypothetical protein
MNLANKIYKLRITSMTDENFCDGHCTWLDHHPDCSVPVGWLGVNNQGEIGKFRTSQFNGSMPLFAHSEKVNKELLAAAQQAILALNLATSHTVDAGDVLTNLISAVRNAT